MLGRTHSLLCPRTAGRARLPHVLSTAGGPFRLDAAYPNVSLLPADKTKETKVNRLSSLAVDAHLAAPQIVPFPPPPILSSPRSPDTYLQEVGREAPMLQAIRARVAEGETNAFNMYDLEIVREQLHRFRRNLPRVQPFYAMKCNPDERIVELLASEGANFDCASKAEIEVACRNGATPDRIIFANPCKQPSHVAFAASAGVDISTFDGADELFKIHALQPNARLVYRVMVDDSAAKCTMSQKYGAPLSDLPELLALARSLNLNVVGVSYHVGAWPRCALARRLYRRRIWPHQPPSVAACAQDTIAVALNSWPRPPATHAPLSHRPVLASTTSPRRERLDVGAALCRRRRYGAPRL